MVLPNSTSHSWFFQTPPLIHGSSKLHLSFMVLPNSTSHSWFFQTPPLIHGSSKLHLSFMVLPNSTSHSWFFQTPPLILIETTFNVIPFIHFAPTTSLLSIFNPLTMVNAVFGQMFISGSPSTEFSVIAFETAFLALFLMIP